MIHVYTGNGKGKTTAAVGLAVRASGAGKKICLIQFLKGCTAYNELKTLKKLSGKCRIVRFKEQHPIFCSRDKKKAAAKLKKQAAGDLEAAKKLVLSKKFDLVIMDEIINLASQGFVPEKELIALIRSAPRKLELVLTGRGASRNLLREADYATDMRLIKHPYYRGKKPRKGIEY